MISLVSNDYGISEKRELYYASICINASLVGVISKDRNFKGIKQIAIPKDYYLDILESYTTQILYFFRLDNIFSISSYSRFGLYNNVKE